jgi:MoaA/NifB/PqqE/SkfB family radical SAM enzyme
MPDMPREKVLRIIDNVANSSVLLLSIEGGEPLLRSDIGEILEYIRTKPLYVLFTTSGKLIDRRPMKEYAKLMDFLHISIDEGHRNLDLYDHLPEFATWGPIVCAQIVVMRDYLQDLEWKIEKCHKAGTKAVVMPAAHLPGTEDLLPEINAFRNEVLRLKQKYPQTIITTDKYLKTLDVPYSCNTSSLRVDADGRLYYPCQMCVEKTIDASQEPILEFLHSGKAIECREKMRSCGINCHSYLYFAMDSSLSLRSTISALMPYARSLI